MPQGISAEMIAEKWGISREEMDAFGCAASSYAARARDEGRFESQILPVLDAEGTLDDDRRGHPRERRSRSSPR